MTTPPRSTAASDAGTPRERSRRWALGLALIASAAACGEPPAEAPAIPSRSARHSPRSSSTAGTITLLTGDRVTVTGTGQAARVEVQPGPGRESVGFDTTQDAGRIMVIPADMVALLAAGRLDPALFDVTRLLGYGYGDDRRDDLPVILTGQSDVVTASAGLSAARAIVSHALPALHAVALRAPKAGGAAVLAQLARGPVQPSSGAGLPPAKLWLDRPLKPLLDRSVPQIGAPAAYARGFTGAGVTVAVLDTGIDDTHPDLAGKVFSAQEFVGDGLGTSDVFGHGTHVASIIAGSGAASNGLYHGVAPDAVLLSGRVCDEFDCPESALLAGMEWAVIEMGARIVNMSLGAPDDPEIDPVEQAVQDLSARYGALFVIAAGNDGPGAATIDSPGSADAALTVGAVDHDDVLASFSSVGPRLGDSGLKPELTAPGVDIVAARAAIAGPDLGGTPVGTAYLRLSGTSMATPHVSGAAALLRQQHPAWTGAQLKAGLIASASPAPELTAFQQGAGRLDVDRATRQLITVTPAAASFGVARWPHDDDRVSTRTLTYHNDGDAPITLTLAGSLALPDHRAAAPGTLSLSATTLSVAAHDTATVDVAIDTRTGGPDGDYSGTVTASAGDLRVVTPIAIGQEVESYDLTLSALDLTGAPTRFVAFVTQPGSPLPQLLFSAAPTRRLQRARYAILQLAIGPDNAQILVPRLELSHDTAITLDARITQPIDAAVAQRDLTFNATVVTFLDLEQGGVTISRRSRLRTGQLGPDAPPGQIASIASRLGSPTGAAQPPSTVYAIAHLERDHFVTGWHQAIDPGQLATVHAHHLGIPGAIYSKGALAVMSGEPALFAPLVTTDYVGPFDRTELYFGDGVTWFSELDHVDLDSSLLFETQAARSSYQPGQRYVERWNQAPFGPALSDATGFAPAARFGDLLRFSSSLFAARSLPSNSASSATTEFHTALFRDGERLDGFDFDPGSLFAFDVPAAPATYRLEQDATRGPSPLDSSPLFDLSTHVSAAWTFTSQHVDGTAPALLALPTPRFLPQLDDQNRASGRALVLPIAIERPAGTATPRIASLTVDASFDDGGSWAHVPALRVGDAALGLVIHPPGASFVSLRATVSDVAGNQGTVTIVRAYALARRAR